LLRTILISFLHIANTERNITRKFRQVVSRNSEFTGAVVTFQLGPAQQLKWKRFYPIFLR